MDYQLVRKLGEGGMGAVYLGQHQLLGRRAAIKVLLAVYNAAAPSKDTVRAARRSLNACHTAGAINDADYDQTQAALVSRL